MSKAFRHIILFLIFSLILLSCEESALFNSGDKVIEIRDLDNFNYIIVNDIFDIYLVQDTINQMIIECGENLIPDLDIHLDDTILVLNNNNNFRWTREYERIKLTIHFDYLRRMRLNEPSFLESVNHITSEKFTLFAITELVDMNLKLDIDNLYLVTNSVATGMIGIEGRTRYCNLRMRGSTLLRAEDFICQDIRIRFNSIADAYIHVTNTLDVEIDAGGIVYYTGNPEIIKYSNTFSDDQLIKLD